MKYEFVTGLAKLYKEHKPEALPLLVSFCAFIFSWMIVLSKYMATAVVATGATGILSAVRSLLSASFTQILGAFLGTGFVAFAALLIADLCYKRVYIKAFKRATELAEDEDEEASASSTDE